MAAYIACRTKSQILLINYYLYIWEQRFYQLDGVIGGVVIDNGDFLFKEIFEQRFNTPFYELGPIVGNYNNINSHAQSP